VRPLIGRGGRAVPGFILIFLFAGLTVYPVLRFLLLPFFAGAGEGISHLGGVSLEALENSVRLGVEATLWALVFGVPFAWLLERRRWLPGKLLMLMLWLVFVTPSYLMTTGWQIVFSQSLLAHGWLSRAFYGEAGIVFLLALKGLPFATIAARMSWRAIGHELDDAARLLIRNRIERRITILQLLLPSAAAAFAIVFVENIQEFGVPATLGAQIHLPIVTYSIYERLATTPVDFAGAALLSWQLVALALLAVALQLYFASRYSSALVHGRRRTAPPPECSALEAAFAWTGLWLIFALGVAVPFAAMVDAALHPIGIAAAREIDWSSILYSSLYAFVAALVAVALAAPVLLRQRMQRGAFGTVVGALSLANMALPGIVLGAAYLIAFNTPLLPLYGTPLLLVMAYVAVQVPMLLRFLQAPVEHVHPSLSEAARVHSVPFAARVLDIDTPLLAPAFTWGWMMAFVQIFFELPISELLFPAGKAPVGVTLVLLNQTLDYTGEARLALAAIFTALAVAGIAGVLIRWLTAPKQADGSMLLAGQPA
jgi:iron(III) transport system permease protein